MKIAKLPKEGQNCPSGMNLIVSGWGAFDIDALNPQRYLWAVKQKCFNATKCSDGVHRSVYNGDPKSIICAGDPDAPSNSACLGDSGGSYLKLACYKRTCPAMLSRLNKISSTLHYI